MQTSFDVSVYGISTEKFTVCYCNSLSSICAVPKGCWNRQQIPRICYKKSVSIMNKVIRADLFQRKGLDIKVKGHYKCNGLTLEGTFTTPDGSFTVNMNSFF